MSTNQARDKTIKYFLNNFKKKELYLINYIFLFFKKTDDNLCSNIRIGLQNIGDLRDIKILLNDILCKLDENQLNFLKEQKIYSNNMFLPLNEIRKINNNKRFINFIDQKNSLINPIKFGDTFDQNKKFLLSELKLNDILNIQQIAINEIKIDFFMKTIENHYFQLINHKKNLNKYIEDNEFSVWAFNYLNKKSTYMTIGAPINNNDYKEYINNYFDKLFLSNNLQYEKEIESLKKAWQQKQFRDQGKIKKEYHLPLTKQTKNELSNLAKFNNLSENAMLEKLIHQAYLSEMCDEKGKSQY